MLSNRCESRYYLKRSRNKTVLVQGAYTQAILMTLLRSAELQGANPVENLLAIVKNAITAKTPSGLTYKIAC